MIPVAVTVPKVDVKGVRKSLDIKVVRAADPGGVETFSRELMSAVIAIVGVSVAIGIGALILTTIKNSSTSLSNLPNPLSSSTVTTATNLLGIVILVIVAGFLLYYIISKFRAATAPK